MNRQGLEPALRGELCRLWGAGCYQAGRFDVAREAIEEAVVLLAETGPLDREAWAQDASGRAPPVLRQQSRASTGRGVAEQWKSSGPKPTSSDWRRPSACWGRSRRSRGTRTRRSPYWTRASWSPRASGSGRSSARITRFVRSHISTVTRSTPRAATSMPPPMRRPISREPRTASSAMQESSSPATTSSSPRRRSGPPRGSGSEPESTAGRSSRSQSTIASPRSTPRGRRYRQPGSQGGS